MREQSSQFQAVEVEQTNESSLQRAASTLQSKPAMAETVPPPVVAIRCVQELAESGGEPPAEYIKREADRPAGCLPPPPSGVPLIDLRLLSRDDGAEIAKLRSALQSWGMFQAVGHGMSAGFLDAVRAMAREFFALPMGEKLRYSRPDGDRLRREGYGNDEVRWEGQVLDWSDRLYLVVLPEGERRLDVWPETPSCFRETLHEYVVGVRSAVDVVLRGIAMALGLGVETAHLMTDKVGDHNLMAFARFNYYPRCRRPELVMGIKPHTDATVLTAVLQDPAVDGLQLLLTGGDGSDTWVDAPARPHALLFNAGDLMQIMGNGILKSPVHRVVVNSEKDRISMALFFSLQLEEEVEPLAELVGDGGEKLYRKVRFGDYLKNFFDNFSQGKTDSIDFAKA